MGDKRTMDRAPQVTPKLHLLICAILLVVASFTVYCNSLPNDFVWDDKDLVVNNPDIKEFSFKNIKTILTRDVMHFVEKSNFYRPLQSLSYMLDYTVWGPNPSAFRAINILIHSVNGVIIFFLLYMIFRQVAVSFFLALFFVVHPVNTSAVAYVSGRADLLALFFLLFSCIFLLRFKERNNIADGWISALFFGLSLLTKEACVVFPLVAIILFRVGLDGKKYYLCKKEKVFFGALFLIAIAYLISRLTVLKFMPLTSQAVNAPDIGRRLLWLPEVILTYLRLIVLPYDLRMDRDLAITSGLFDPQIVLSIGVIVALLMLFTKYLAKERSAMIGLAWFLILLFPSLNVILPLNAPISEHWLYLPFFGALIIFGSVAAVLSRRVKLFTGWIYTGVLIAIAIYGGITVYINGFWKNETTLFSYISKYEKVNLRSYYFLGCRYLGEKKYDDAIAAFKKALQKNPSNYEAMANMAAALDALGRYDEAGGLYEASLQLGSKNIAAYNNLGVIYAKKELYDKAREVWEKGLSLAPDSQEIRENLGRLAMITNQSNSGGRYDLAIEEAKKALELDANNVGLHNNLGVFYSLSGDDERAVTELKKVLELNPSEGGAYKNIAIILSKYPKRYEEAVEYFKRYLLFCSSEEERVLVLEKMEEINRELKNNIKK